MRTKFVLKNNFLLILIIFFVIYSPYLSFAVSDVSLSEVRQQNRARIMGYIDQALSRTEYRDNLYNSSPSLNSGQPVYAFKLLLENIGFFPFSLEHPEYQRQKVKILQQLLVYHGGYTFPSAPAEYITQGRVSDLIKWIEKEEKAFGKGSGEVFDSKNETYVMQKKQKKKYKISAIASYYAIAYMYEVGLGVERDRKMALKYLKKAYSLDSKKRLALADKHKNPYFSLGTSKIDSILRLVYIMRDLIDPAILSFKSGMERLETPGMFEGAVKMIERAAEMGYPPAKVKLAELMKDCTSAF